MKKLALFTSFFIILLFACCSEDETIEEQVFKQENLSSEVAFSGEEGHDGTDDIKDQ